MKKFLIIGNANAITYKEVFPLIKENKIWLGVSKRSMNFIVSDEGETVNVNACWFTNLDHKKRHEELILYKKYNEAEYPKYDNYDAINVDKVCDIPYDYKGVMGVPMTFLDRYNSDQFEIIGITENADYLKPLYVEGCKKYDRPYMNGKRMYSRILIRFKK